mgnify:CR=1 FL=1|jgi:predicted site-specific integrase-resolvase
MELSVAQCAEMVGVTARTIQLKIKSGKISAQRDSKGNYAIESSEFFRVYPKAKLSENKTKLFGEPNESTNVDLKHKVELLEQELKSLKGVNSMLETQLDQASKREQDLIEISKSSTRLLEDKSTAKRKKIFGLI